MKKSSLDRIRNKINNRKLTTSIGSSTNTRPKHKNKRKGYKKYKGQGR